MLLGCHYLNRVIFQDKTLTRAFLFVFQATNQYRGVTPFGPPMWQADADTELTLSASPTTAVGQKLLALAKRRYSTVCIFR